MRNTTLGYLYCGNDWLMLYRNKKKNDLNQGKWVGVGGKFEAGETAEECFLREVREETGFVPVSYRQIGLIHFRSDIWEDEEMYLYVAELSAEDRSTELPVCAEGELAWIPREQVMDLPMWEGDRLFLPPLLEGKSGIEMTLIYQGDDLVEYRIGAEDAECRKNKTDH